MSLEMTHWYGHKIPKQQDSNMMSLQILPVVYLPVVKKYEYTSIHCVYSFVHAMSLVVVTSV
jgi:hypothetical protein